MKDIQRLFLPALACISVLSIPTGCSTAGVEARQESISEVQSNILSNREARIQARDERMRASRDVWMQ